MAFLDRLFQSELLNHPSIRRYTALINEDLTATYSRDIQKWLLVAPIIGVVTGLFITGIATLILDTIWVRVLPYYLLHHWAIVIGLLIGFTLTGLIMQFRTPDPDEHSTEEIIRSYHEHQGDIDVRSFWWKILAAVTTVGIGRQRRAGRAKHLWRRRDRLMAMDQAAPIRTGPSRSPHHAHQRSGGRNGGGVSRAADRTGVRARDAVQRRPRA